MPAYVYAFAEGNKDQKDLLGGKGANLAEMTNMGLPVPPGFVITTEACRAYLRPAAQPPELAGRWTSTWRRWRRRGASGSATPRIRCWSRCGRGPRFSMPGMMETVLNVGLNDESVHGLARGRGDDRFAWDSYRRLVQMFGRTVLGIDNEHFDAVFDGSETGSGHLGGSRSGRGGSASRSSPSFKAVILEQRAGTFPQDPREQLDLTVRAVFDVVELPRAITYRRQRTHPRRPGDRGERGGHGVRQPGPRLRVRAWRSPATRRPGSRACTATTWPTPRARTSSPASATR